MTHGHLSAKIDPLELEKVYENAEVVRKFNPFGMSLRALLEIE